MKKNIAVKIENLSKLYKLYNAPVDRLKETMHPLRKKYHNTFYALNNISFEIKQGESVGIIGKNGSGKSTLLKIITGVLSPTEGEVSVEGKISALLELGAGFNPEFTGIENIYMNALIMGYGKKEVDEKLESILTFADIGQFVYQPVKTYSSGMFARLAFAVAINVEPDILIVDEALSVGDIFFQAKCYKKFDEFKKKGKTILFVTHDMGSIIKYCDRAIVLNEGLLVEDGSPEKMIDIYKKILVNQYASEEPKPEIELEQNLEENNCENGNWSQALQLNPDRLEYGDKQAEIVDFAMFDEQGKITNIVIQGKTCSFRIKVRINETINEPIFAFTIKDLKGTEIAGTNTLYETVPVGMLTANQTIEITFKQKIQLQGGNYLLSFGCTGFENEGFVVYHRLYDIFDICVLADKSTVGFFDLESRINIKIIQ